MNYLKTPLPIVVDGQGRTIANLFKTVKLVNDFIEVQSFHGTSSHPSLDIAGHYDRYLLNPLKALVVQYLKTPETKTTPIGVPKTEIHCPRRFKRLQDSYYLKAFYSSRGFCLQILEYRRKPIVTYNVSSKSIEVHFEHFLTESIWQVLEAIRTQKQSHAQA